MKNLKKLLAVIVAAVLICLQIPMGVFAADGGVEWSTTNLVEGQADILLNGYNPTYLDVTLEKDTGYRLDYTITFNTNVAGNWNRMSNMLRQSESDLISFGAWNDAGDGTGQLRFAENDIDNNSYTAVEGVGTIPAGMGYPISIVIMPDYVELYVGGQLQTMWLPSLETVTQIPVSKRIENGKVGFIGQGSHPDITISDIALYCEAGAEVPVEPEVEWSTTNLVEGQADFLLNNYEARYLDVTLDKDTGYRLDYTLTFNTNVAGNWNYMSNMLRESESDLISFGAWNDCWDGTGQLRFAENDKTNNSYTAVEGVGVIPAGVEYPISIVIMPDYVELYVGGQLQTMYFPSGDTATQIPVSKRIENGKVGFIGQGSHPDITISDIALYCEAGAELPVEPEIEWSETNAVDGYPSLTLDYFWKWMPTTIKGSESYKYSFNFIAPETTSSRYPTVAVRDVSENSDGEDGLYVVFNNIDDQIRIGTHYTTNGDALLAVAGNAGLKPAGTYKVEIITTPNSIKVYMNGNLITFMDMVSGNYQLMTEVPTKEFADAKAGFITQGAVTGTQITDIAIYTEYGKEQVEPIVFSAQNAEAFKGDEFDVVISVDSNPGIIFAELDIAYDSDVFELVGVKDGDFDLTFENEGENTNCYNYSDITKNPFVVCWTNPVGKNVYTTGKFVVLTFKVKETAVDGIYDISIVPDNTGNIFNAALTDIPAESITASVVVKADLAGDVNDDKVVNGKDVALLMQYINGWDVEINLDVADVRADGIINAKDYALLLRYLNGWDVQLG